MPKRTLYEKDGAVYRRVEEDLGGGQRSVVGDTMLHPDIDTFLEEHPDAVVVREATGERRYLDPEKFTLKELPGALSKVDSADELLALMERDSRVTADSIYLERLSELVDAASDTDAEAEEEQEPDADEEGDGDDSDEE